MALDPVASSTAFGSAMALGSILMIRLRIPAVWFEGATEGYCVLADRRVFAVMAFLNAVGYDDEARGAKMHPLRLKVRKQVADNLSANPEKLRAWKDYYKHRRFGDWQYANWALTLCSDYPFRRVRPNKELLYPWTAYMLADFPEMLNDFWRAAKLESVWAECQPDYLAEVKRYSVRRMADEMSSLWAYLRMRRSDNYIIIQVPNPLQRHASACANTHQPYLYSIDGPGSNGGGLNVHEYIHTVMNPLMKKAYPAQKKKLSRYFQAGKDAPISASSRSGGLVHRMPRPRSRPPSGSAISHGSLSQGHD